ncbi:MAG: alpha/beta hydrolase [Bifidobacterium sp.]|nr:alpha/beta hydrolase [Bifidobacterium sp.]
MEIAMIDERHFEDAIETTVRPALETCRTDGYLEPAHEDHLGRPLKRLPELGRLHYVVYDLHTFRKLGLPGASREDHGTVVFSHGFSEFAAKYKEMAWYFLLAGFSVCILEHRGHGYSPRDCADTQIVYIDDWRRYVADYAKFTNEVGRLQAGDGPLVLFGHSMGGGIAAAMLERYPNIVDKAVLSSPMIEANTGAPGWMAAGVCGLACDLGFGKRFAPGMHAFRPEIDWTAEGNASHARVEWFQKLRIGDPHYQTCPASNSWVLQAVRLSHAILPQEECARIETPILLVQAGHDHWVHNSAQDAFAKRVNLDGGLLEMHRVPDSVHEIFSMPNATMAPYLTRIFRYLQTTESVTVLP